MLCRPSFCQIRMYRCAVVAGPQEQEHVQADAKVEVGAAVAREGGGTEIDTPRLTKKQRQEQNKQNKAAHLHFPSLSNLTTVAGTTSDVGSSNTIFYPKKVDPTKKYKIITVHPTQVLGPMQAARYVLVLPGMCCYLPLLHSCE